LFAKKFPKKFPKKRPVRRKRNRILEAVGVPKTNEAVSPSQGMARFSDSPSQLRMEVSYPGIA
jgi:hypothetical protein